MFSNLNQVLEQVAKDKGVDKKILTEVLETAMLTAAKKKYGMNAEIEAHFNEDLGEVELFQFKEVLEEIDDPLTQISIEEARQLDPDSEIGDSLGMKLETEEFGRIAAQTAKQVIVQRIREAERDRIYDEYKDRKHELVTGIARRFERGNIIVDLGRVEAILTAREQAPRESYRAGDRIQAYVLDIQKTSKGPQVILSRTDPGMLIKLFEMEVPEIYEGIVNIKSAAREPGGRAKIAVASRDPDVDPVGACVGMKGSRVQAVVQELRGEKIDIVPWDEDPAKFVCNAIAPAEVARVLIDEEEKTMELIVPDDQLSLAIGKKGQNVRLAAQLTGWKIEIKSESRIVEEQQQAKEALVSIDGVTGDMVDSLMKLGYYSLWDIAKTKVEDIAIVPGVGKENAEKIVEGAKKALEKQVLLDSENRARARSGLPPIDLQGNTMQDFESEEKSAEETEPVVHETPEDAGSRDIADISSNSSVEEGAADNAANNSDAKGEESKESKEGDEETVSGEDIEHE
ncbi:MAG: transcription termination/antitermination protein NusA [Deltaproteobacteria bacterium]|nr:transcription termination/antitermination protein NusA [Deltaproteobacteria bacterium]